MATTPILGRDIYMALAAVGWADGELTPEAADAIVRAALDEGLALEDIAAIEEATQNRIDVGTIDRLGMSKSDRLYVYAVASWITELDGHVSESEKEALAKLGDALGVPETPRRHADGIMKEIAARADKPERFDLVALRETLDRRLEEAHQMRIAHLQEKEEREAAAKAREKEAKKAKAAEGDSADGAAAETKPKKKKKKKKKAAAS